MVSWKREDLEMVMKRRYRCMLLLVLGVMTDDLDALSHREGFTGQQG